MSPICWPDLMMREGPDIEERAGACVCGSLSFRNEMFVDCVDAFVDACLIVFDALYSIGQACAVVR